MIGLPVSAWLSILLCALLAFGCESKHSETHKPSEQAANDSDNHIISAQGSTSRESDGTKSKDDKKPLKQLADGTRIYGADFSKALEPIKVAALTPKLAQSKAGQTLRLEGQVAKVCQAMGCWLELRDPAALEKPGVRVPFFGHSFLMPTSEKDKYATVQGTFSVVEANLGSDTHVAYQLEAKTVAVRP